MLEDAAYYIRSETAIQITDNPIVMPRVAPPGEELKVTKGDAINGLLDELCNFNGEEIKYFEFQEITIATAPDKTDWLDHLDDQPPVGDLPLQVKNLYSEGPWKTVQIHRVDGGLHEIRLNQEIVENRCRISLSTPSSDPVFGVFGCLGNMIFAVHPADRPLIQGLPEEVRLSDSEASKVASSPLLPAVVDEQTEQPGRYREAHRKLRKKARPYMEEEDSLGKHLRTTYRNIVELAKHLSPDLGFVDGTFVLGGEGESPVDVAEGRFALSGDDPVAVDTVLADIVGLEVDTLGQLKYLEANHVGSADMSDVQIAVGDLDELTVEFEPHPREEKRKGWQDVILEDEGAEAVGYVSDQQEAGAGNDGEPEPVAETAGQTTEQTEQADTDTTSASTSADTEEAGSETAGASASATDVKEESGSDGESSGTQETATGGSSAGTASGDGDLSVRERIERRLIERGKLEGEITEKEAPEEQEGTVDKETEEPSEEEPSGDTQEETTADTETAADEDTTEEKEQTDQSDEEALREQARERLKKWKEEGGDWHPGEDDVSSDGTAASEPAGAPDPDTTMGKIASRLEKRRKAVSHDSVAPDFVEEKLKRAAERSPAEDRSKDQAGDEPEPETEEAATPEQEPEQEEETEEDASDETRETSEGYVHDPDKSVKERIRERLESRGKL